MKSSPPLQAVTITLVAVKYEYFSERANTRDGYVPGALIARPKADYFITAPT